MVRVDVIEEFEVFGKIHQKIGGGGGGGRGQVGELGWWGGGVRVDVKKI